MKIKRKIIKIDEELCNGCGQCVPDCAEGSLQIIDGKARLVADKLCDGLGACLGSCPTGALQIIEREAEEFDEEAVEHFLAAKAKEPQPTPPLLGGGCPSARLQTLQPMSPCQAANVPGLQSGSALSHWPVQIRLIPAAAPFLENCDLLVAAALLHDIGYVRCFVVGEATVDQTEEGRMLGHLVIGQQMVDEVSRQVGLAPDRRLALLHVIGWHHGPPPGAHISGASPEAIALWRANALEAGVQARLEGASTLDEA